MLSDTLFTTFSRNLTLYNPDYQDSFLCPLQVSPKCQKLYGREDIGKLNKAHIWQASLGGKQWTLACEDCNSFVGTKLESHASNHAKFVQSKQFRYRMNYEGVEGSEGGTLEITEEEGMIKPVFRRNSKVSNPITKAAVDEVYDASGELPKMEIGIDKGFEERRVSLAYLHFAYLYLFHEYGYEWFDTPFAHEIRQQLKYPEKRLFEASWTFIEFNASRTPPDTALHVFTTQPDDLRGLQIVSPQLEYANGRRVAVFLFLAQPNVHNSEISFALPPEYFAGLNASLSTPSHSVHEQLANRKGLLKQAWLSVFSR